MSIKIMTNVWQFSRTRGSDLVAMLALADWAGPDGVSWYPLAQLMERVRIKDRKGGRRLVGRLVDTGELYIVERYHPNGRQRTNMYAVLVGAEPGDLEGTAERLGVDTRILLAHQQEGPEAAESLRLAIEEAALMVGGPPDPPGVQAPLEEGPQTPPRGGLTDPPKDPSIDPKERSTKGAAPSQFAEILKSKIPNIYADPAFLEAWQNWEAARKEIKKPLTPAAVRAQCTKIKDWGLDASLAALTHSAAGGYQGLFLPGGRGVSPAPRPSNPAPGLVPNGTQPVGQGMRGL